MELQQQDDRESPWDFTAARKFLQTYSASPTSSLIEDDSIPNVKLFDPKSNAPKGLGDFNRLFAFFDKAKPRRRSNDSSSTQHDGDSTPPSSLLDDTEHFENFVIKAKEVRWTDQEGTADLAQFRRRSTRGSTVEDLDGSVIAQLLDETDPSDLESDTEGEATRTPKRGVGSGKTKAAHTSVLQSSPVKYTKRYQKKQHSVNSTTSLVLASLSPSKASAAFPGPPRVHPPNLVDPSTITPFYTLTPNEQKVKILKKLARKFKEEASLLLSPRSVVDQVGNRHSDGIHVFVDLSNIVIGFTEVIKINRIEKGRLDPFARTKQPPFSFHSLSLVLERGRPVKRRVLVGSNSNTLKLPDHVIHAEKLGYEPNILERVIKPRPQYNKKKHGTGSGYATSGSETQSLGPLKMQEQAVDELLQMKMLESMLDSEPSTMILASGDAAEAEYSGGFLKTVERALNKGWKVEVMAWSRGLSQEYRNQTLLKKWAGRLSIFELDEYGEEMLAIYARKFLYDPYA